MQQLTLEIFAQRLKRLREQHGLTTRELGDIIGTSNATISRYERGKRDPDLVIAYKLAKYFKVPLEYLCGEDVDIDVEKMVQLYSALSEEAKKDAMKFITYLYETQKGG